MKMCGSKDYMGTLLSAQFSYELQRALFKKLLKQMWQG